MKKMRLLCILAVLAYMCIGIFVVSAESSCPHTDRKVELVSAATCKSGSIEREVCTLCGVQLDQWTNSDQLAHSWKTEIVSTATCTEGSVEREICANCGDVNDKWTNSDQLGHSWKSEIVSAATCTEGSKEREICIRCGIVNDQWTNSDQLGHSWKTEVISSATCTQGSTEREVCTRCGKENRRWTNDDAIGHKPGAAATCTTPQVCTVCMFELSPAKGHVPGDSATCGKAQLCKVCGMVLANALEHSFQSVVYKPTETRQGFTRYTCSLCGYSYDDNFKKALGKIQHASDGFQLIDDAGQKVPYITEEAADSVAAGQTFGKLLRIIAQTNNQYMDAGYVDLLLAQSEIESILEDGYRSIGFLFEGAEVLLPLEGFIRNDALNAIQKDQNLSDTEIRYVIRISKTNSNGIADAFTPAFRVDVLIGTKESELDISDVIGGLAIRLQDNGANHVADSAGLSFIKKMAGENSAATLGPVSYLDGWWESLFQGSGVYMITGK